MNNWLCAMALTVVAIGWWFKPSPTNDSNPTEKTAAELFATLESQGNLAIGVAEGNLTPDGRRTPYYARHLDPGNQATNKGFCSLNGADALSVAQADAECLQRLQRQSAQVEQQFQQLGLNQKQHLLALVNGTDLMNQSPAAGEHFAHNYSRALHKKLPRNQAIIWARVESFRDGNHLSASGLFRICRTHAFYRQQLASYPAFSESWKWKCISLDQNRRLRAIQSIF